MSATPLLVRRARWTRPAAAGALLALLAAGCGNPTLWTRYQAERDFWRARREVERIRINPGTASEADYRRAASLLQRLEARYPARTWTAPDRLEAPYGREVAMLSGRAAVGLARLEEMRGRTDAALAGYERVTSDYRALPPVALEAALARARTLERADRFADATAAWAAVARDFPLVDPELRVVIRPVLDAPLKVAREWTAHGRAAAADSILRAARARLEAALASPPTPAAGAELWFSLADVRAALGDPDGARDALRRALALGGEAVRPRVVLTLAQRALQAGRADSAIVYGRWAEREFQGEPQAQGMLLEGQAWEMRGPPDSALAVYGRMLERWPGAGGAGAVARFRRALVLEKADRWEQARTEYRALSASNPTHELAFAALLQVVLHHARRGERELAGIEGQRAIETLDQLIATNRDETVQLQARRTRAEIQMALGNAAGALNDLAEIWSRWPDQPAGAEAGFRAAQIAEGALHDLERARALYRDLAARVESPALRSAAEAALARLGQARS